jgi:hypothetical protein
MQLQIVVDYRVPADEFDDLIKVYPLGKYHWGGQSRWFCLTIDGHEGQIELTWFRLWE